MRTTERPPSVQPLRVGVKKLYRVGRGIPDAYLAFRFGAKLTILGATNGVAGVKNPD